MSTPITSHSFLRPVLPFVALVLVLAVEMSPVGQWIYETGAIHLFAITFATIGFGVWMSPRISADHDFHVFARFAAMAMLAFGLAHVMEYFGDTRHLFGEDVVGVIVSGSYLVAFLLVIAGANGLMHLAGMPARRVNGALAALGAAHITVSASRFVAGGLPSEMVVQAHGAILLIAAALAVVLLQLLGRKMSVLVGFVRHLRYAVVLVLVSYSFEVFFVQLEMLGLSEQRIENFAHYLFYTGLTVMFLSFDSLRHLGGVFADLEKESKQSVG